MQVTYSTYRERDYDAIWDRYAYQNGRPEWFQKVIAARTPPALCYQGCTLSSSQCDVQELSRLPALMLRWRMRIAVPSSALC